MTGVEHGGLRQAELDALGLSRADVLDLSASVHPAGPHADVVVAAARAELRRYPDADAAELRDALAELEGLEASRLLVTPGATAGIHLAAHALLAPGSRAVVFGPTFGEYAAAGQAAGAEVEERPLSEVEHASAAALAGAGLVALCNPNNPTGEYRDRPAVEALAAAVAEARGVLLLDVAYDPFVEDAWDADDLVRGERAVLVVHSLTKLHAVPGLRLGYVTGPPALIGRLQALQPSWSVGAPALAGGLAAARVDGSQRLAAREVGPTRHDMVAMLRAGGFDVREGRANFILVQVGEAAPFRRRLLLHGFAVRDCSSFGLREWVRVAVPPASAIRRLAAAFDRARSEGRP